MAHGTIIQVVVDRGFGFIAPADGDEDLFFHCRQISGMDWDQLLTGRRVTFDLGVDERSSRPRAVRVRAAD